MPKPDISAETSPPSIVTLIGERPRRTNAHVASDEQTRLRGSARRH
jgi:hypothetical protein